MTDSAPGRERGSDQLVRAARRFVTLADTLVDDFDVVELLDRLVQDCVDLLDVSAAGILLRKPDGTLDVVASSSEATRLVEVFQLETEVGPCVEAVATGRAVVIDDIAELRRRWPAFAQAVQGFGFSAVRAIPLRLREETIGALNLFNTDELTMTENDRSIAQALADVATIGILQQRSLARASLLTDQLQLALSTRITVEQANGMLAQYGEVEMDVAFEAIRRFARSRKLKLSDVAAALVSRRLDPEAVLPARPDLRPPG